MDTGLHPPVGSEAGLRQADPPSQGFRAAEADPALSGPQWRTPLRNVSAGPELLGGGRPAAHWHRGGPDDQDAAEAGGFLAAGRRTSSSS